MAALDITDDTIPASVDGDPRETYVYLLTEVVDNLGLHTTPTWQRLTTPGRLLFARMCHRVTGEYPADTEERRARRAEVMAPWVDPDHLRYSHNGPTTPDGGPLLADDPTTTEEGN